MSGCFDISCEDGSLVTVCNGASCSVTSSDGCAEIDCPGNDPVFVCDGQNGTDGIDGSSCSVEDEGNGCSQISCTDGSSAEVCNGADGQTCSVYPSDEGCVTIDCGDNGSQEVCNGQDGAPGSNCSIASDGNPDDADCYFVTCDDGSDATICSGTKCNITDFVDDPDGEGRHCALISCMNGAEDAGSTTICDGLQGVQGASCSVGGAYTGDNGTDCFDISCDGSDTTDPTFATVCNGVSCHIASNTRLPADSGQCVEIDCDDGSSDLLCAQDGTDGVDGTSCSALQLSDTCLEVDCSGNALNDPTSATICAPGPSGFLQ
jgi:hypothetical protein